ncbi:MAG: ImmA/IrrE family metallo-endopeptidase [Marinobacter sp.]|uniref:ImmA/IrrE family metallo-endopeptidase n=1 Tax=Marinobacter sp. TaxID=50741 RepID=UPI0034A0A83B
MASLEWDNLPDNQKKVIEKHQTKFPIPVGAIAKELGIMVKKSTLPAGISGEIKEINGVCLVRVNRHDVKARQRFTLAHEIAHFLLHRDRLRGGITDDVLYRSSLSDVLEAQANRLGADIIMPFHLIRASQSFKSDLKKEAQCEAIAEEAQVSPTAIKIRLGII